MLYYLPLVDLPPLSADSPLISRRVRITRIVIVLWPMLLVFAATIKAENAFPHIHTTIAYALGDALNEPTDDYTLIEPLFLQALPASATHRRKDVQSASSISYEFSDASAAGTNLLRLSDAYEQDRSPANGAGVFLTASSIASSYLDWTLDQLIAAGGDTIIFDAKGTGVYFDTGDMPRATELGLVEPWYDLPALLQKLRDRNVYSVARFIAIKDYGLSGALPEVQIRHPKTNHILSHNWVDPSHPEVLAYTYEVACSLAKAGVGEINLDYIRYQTEKAVALNAYSTEEKVAKIVTYVREIRRAIDDCGPDTKLGISTFAILGWDAESNIPSLGQDLTQLAPLVDIISPMIYPISFSDPYYARISHLGSRPYALVHRTITGHQELLGEEHAHKLRPWIQGFWFDRWGIAEQIRAVYDTGLCGYMVWNADNGYTPTYSAMLQTEKPAQCT